MGLDFLQRDDVGVDLAQHAEDALRSVRPSRADRRGARCTWRRAGWPCASTALRSALQSRRSIRWPNHASAGEAGDRGGHEPRVHARRVLERGGELVGEHGRGEHARQHAEERADHEVEERMRIAPITTFTTRNGAIGTTRTSATASTPLRLTSAGRACELRSREPPRGVAMEEPPDAVAHDAREHHAQHRVDETLHGPNAITAASVMSGRGNITKLAGV